MNKKWVMANYMKDIMDKGIAVVDRVYANRFEDILKLSEIEFERDRSTGDTVVFIAVER